ncbi:MAG: hypothetical protein ACRDA4_08610 [Filifactoraceae bacterium]
MIVINAFFIIFAGITFGLIIINLLTENKTAPKEDSIESFLKKIKNEFKQININSNLEIKPTQIYHSMDGVYTGFYIDTYHSSNEIAVPMVLLTLKNLATKEKIKHKETDLSYFDDDIPKTPTLTFALDKSKYLQLIFQNLEYSDHPLNGVGVIVKIYDTYNPQL